MIGTKIRGFRHLMKVAKTFQEVTFFFKHDAFAVGGGVAMFIDGSKHKNPFMSTTGDYLLLFNDTYDNIKYDGFGYFDKTDLKDKFNEIRNKYPHMWVVPVNKSNYREDYSFFSEIVAMPEDFEKMYSDFCTANKKQMPNVSKYCNVDCSLYKYIFAISSGSKNFFFWAINAYWKNHVSIFQIENILRWNDGYNQLQSKLSKGTITAYTSGYDFASIVREMMLLRRNKRANDVINSFNTAQKKVLKGYTLSDRDYDTLSKFGKLSGKKKSNFIRKMSTIEDPVEILKQMSFLADIHFEWNKKSFMEYINNLEGLNCNVVIDRDNIVLLEVKDYEAVKRLAKATNWCISKDKKYWNEYVEMRSNATQYVMFDFSKKEDDNLSIVGFTTVHDRGITHAHDFQNRNIMGSKRNNVVAEIKSFVSRHIDCSNIYGVLDRNGISLSEIISYEPSHYDWNREDMFDYLNKCVDEYDYYIIYDDGNKVVLIVEDDNVRYFLGDAYMDNRNYTHQDGDQHIIFADFNKKPSDPNKLIFGVIHHNFSTHESSCNRLFNDRFETIGQSFDSKLEEYGLPYDIICRNENVIDRFYTAFSGLELSTVKELLKNQEVLDDIKDQPRTGVLREALINATFGYYSLDYLNLIYDSGLTVTEMIGGSLAADFGRRIINTLWDINDRPVVPSSDALEAFKKGSIENYDSALYTGLFTALMMFVDHEKTSDALSGIVITIFERHRKTELFDLVLTRVCEKLNLNDCGFSKYIIHYAFKNNSVSVINAITKQKLNSKLSDAVRSYVGSDFKCKSTEMWVKRENGTYVLEGINEEQIAHAPRRR